LGQSNAANHGELATTTEPRPAVTAWFQGRCYRISGPFPGGTEKGGAIWSWLPTELASQGVDRPVVIAVLAVGATSVSDWTTPGGPLPRRLRETASDLIRSGQRPNLVLWQQGEADALNRTTAEEYLAGLRALARELAEAGITAPVLLGKSTICQGAPYEPVRDAINAAILTAPFAAGAETDQLTGRTYRSDGCHFTAHGQRTAARAWAQAILNGVISSAQSPDK
jgi:lysophospholipase L1-like esterase